MIKRFFKLYKDAGLVVEDYLLYAAQAASQIQSRMETPKVIGLIQWYCWTIGKPVHLQPAAEVKSRWTNDILIHKNIIKPYQQGFAIAHTRKVLSRHTIDAIRHAVHYSTFKNKR